MVCSEEGGSDVIQWSGVVRKVEVMSYSGVVCSEEGGSDVIQWSGVK